MTSTSSHRPVLLIHGVGSTFAHNWQRLGWVDILRDAGREVVAVELPGHGTEAGRGPADRDSARLILDTARPFGSVDAVGFSAGGYALMRAAVYEPDRFARIALLGIADTGLADKADDSGMRAIAADLLSDVEPAAGMGLFIRRSCRAAGNDRTQVAAYLMSGQPRVARSHLKSISARTLVVEAETDGSAEAIADGIPSAERLTVEGVDHFGLPASVDCKGAVVAHLDAPL